MKPLSELTCCFSDHGRFVHVARTLGKQFGKVFYTSPEERDCPISREACVGDGFEEIERVPSLWQVKDQCDLFCFPDLGFAAEQHELRSQGYPVWGSGGAGALESNKGFFLKTLAENSLPVPPHVVIKGMTNLSLHLREVEDVYLKVSKFRGDFETLHWTNFEEMEGTLDSLAVRFGCLKELVTFYVFEAIDTKIEDGVDAYRVGGKWPETVLHGIECKDRAFIGTMQKFEDLPEEVRCVNEVFGPILDRLTDGGAMKFSTEVRITEEGESFFTDPTCRFGSPPSQGECVLIKNLPEIIARGAIEGVCVEPEYDDAFVVQANVTLDGDRTEWTSFKLDDDVDEALKGGFCCRIGDRLALPPITEYHSIEVGYLCATGETLAAAIKNLSGLRDSLPDGLKCDFNSLAEVLKEIDAAEAKGMEFTPQPVPPPEIVLQSDN
jgi:hypothetical protein